MHMFRNACKNRCMRILAIAVVGYPQPEDGMPTLRPCNVCRELMQTRYRQLLSSTTLIFTALPGGEIRETFTVPQLMEEYGESWVL